MSNQDAQRVVTGEVRLSFVHVFVARAKKPGDAPKFSLTLLIPKHDIATKQRIDAAINAAIQDGIASKWNGVRPPLLNFPIHDGDGVKPSDGMPFNDECKGHWVMTASSQADRKPDVVDANMNPIINQSEVYSGMYGRVSVRFFAYTNQGKKGIGCGLGNLQKIKDGPALSGGGSSAASDFGAPAGYQPPAPSYGQPPYTPPAPQYSQQPAYAPAPQPPVYGQPAQPPAQPPQQQQWYGQAPVQQPPAYAPPVQQPSYPPTAPPPQQIDPITGRPYTGGIMGL